MRGRENLEVGFISSMNTKGVARPIKGPVHVSIPAWNNTSSEVSKMLSWSTSTARHLERQLRHFCRDQGRAIFGRI